MIKKKRHARAKAITHFDLSFGRTISINNKYYIIRSYAKAGIGIMYHSDIGEISIDYIYHPMFILFPVLPEFAIKLLLKLYFRKMNKQKVISKIMSDSELSHEERIWYNVYSVWSK